MGTSNFFNRNASRIFAICMDYETPILDDDGNETDEMEYVSAESWEYDDVKSDLITQIEELKDCNGVGNGDCNRNFSGAPIGRLYASEVYLGQEVGIEIQCLIRSGYYEGANLDYDITYEFGGGTYDDIDGLCTDFIDETVSDYKGFAKIHSKNVSKFLHKKEAELRTKIETIYSGVCGVQLEVVARFSNGETIYKQAV